MHATNQAIKDCTAIQRLPKAAIPSYVYKLKDRKANKPKSRKAICPLIIWGQKPQKYHHRRIYALPQLCADLAQLAAA